MLFCYCAVPTLCDEDERLIELLHVGRACVIMRQTAEVKNGSYRRR